MTVRWQTWAIRLLLGMLFLFGSEILLWTNPLNRPLSDWGLRAVGYTLLATLILDLAVRYRIQDEYDSMALIAIYGLLAGVLITPVISFADFPRTLLTRVIGGHGLVGIEMFGLFLAMTNGNNKRMRRLLLGALVWIGFYWGTWLHWMPIYGTLFPTITLETAFVLAGIVFGMAMLVWGGVRLFAKTNPAPELTPAFPPQQLLPVGLNALNFKLSIPEWLFLVLVGLLLFVYQALQYSFTSVQLTAMVLLVGVSWAVLWFRRKPKGTMLLDAHFPMKPIPGLWLVAGVVIFVVSAIFAYVLPLAGNDQVNQLWLMEIGFGAVGTLWYPTIAVVIAFRGVDTQMRMNEL